MSSVSTAQRRRTRSFGWKIPVLVIVVVFVGLGLLARRVVGGSNAPAPATVPVKLGNLTASVSGIGTVAAAQIGAAHHPLRRHADFAADVAGDHRIVAGQNLQLNAVFRQGADGRPDARAGRILEADEADQDQALFVGGGVAVRAGAAELAVPSASSERGFGGVPQISLPPGGVVRGMPEEVS